MTRRNWNEIYNVKRPLEEGERVLLEEEHPAPAMVTATERDEAIEVVDTMGGVRGQQTLVRAPKDHLPSNLQGVANGIYRQPERVLDSTLANYGLAMLGLGTYQLVMSAKAELPKPDAVSLFVPLIAEVEYGAGGISHSFECDPNQIIAVPGDTIRVALKWDELNFGYNGTAFTPIRIPDMRVWTSIVRSGQSAPNRVTRTVFATFDLTVQQVRVKVPPFARSFRVYSPAITVGGVTDWSASVTGPMGTAATPYDRMVASDFTKFVKGSCCRPLRWDAEEVVVERIASASYGPLSIEFQLSFGNGGC